MQSAVPIRHLSLPLLLLAVTCCCFLTEPRTAWAFDVCGNNICGGNPPETCTTCPEDCGPCLTDTDSDGVIDVDDNCVTTSNPLQEDCDGDGIGNACDSFDGTTTSLGCTTTVDRDRVTACDYWADCWYYSCYEDRSREECSTQYIECPSGKTWVKSETRTILWERYHVGSYVPSLCHS